MPVPSTPQDLINLIREKLFNNTSGKIDEPSIREVLEWMVKVLDAKFSLFSPELTEEQYSKWNLMLDYMVRETKGVLTTTSTAPTEKGKYLLAGAGTYTNLGGLITTADKLNYAYFNGTTWRLIAADLPQPIVNNYINHNTYNLDPNQIVPSEALYNDETLAGDVYQRIDVGSGIPGNLKQIDVFFDNTQMDDAKVDGIIYRKIENNYVVNTLFYLNKVINISTFNYDFFKAIDFCNGKGEIKLIINKSINLQGDSFTIPKNITLEFSQGAKIQHGIINIGGCKLIDTYQQIFENCEISGNFNDYKGRPEWFGAKNDLSSDCLDAFNQVSKIANNIILSGRYKFLDTWEIENKKGFSIHGEFNQNIGFVNKTEAKILLDFDLVPKDKDGLKISNFVGLSLSNFFVSFYRGVVGGTTTISNAAIRLFNGHDFKISSLRINALDSNNTSALILGNNTGATCTFLGTVENVKTLVSNNAIGIGTFGGNTSISFRSCYVAGGGYWHIEGTVYSTFLNCACDNAAFYGYLIKSNVDYNATNLSFISCGSESCGKTGFWISDYVQNIDFLNPYEANNNTLNTANDGALFVISPNTWAKNIKITNPSSYSQHGNYSMVFNGNIDNIFVESTNKKNVINGFGGASLNKVSISGDYELTAFTPSIENATITEINNIKAFWKKTGDGFEIFILIDGDFTTTSGSSFIQLPFNVGRGISNIVQLNGYAKPQMLINDNKIWLPSMDINSNEPITIIAKSTLYQKNILGM